MPVSSSIGCVVCPASLAELLMQPPSPLRTPPRYPYLAGNSDSEPRVKKAHQ